LTRFEEETMEPPAKETAMSMPGTEESKRDISTARITSDDTETYLANRVEQYANWYDKKCGPLKQRFLYIKAVTVIGGALVPVVITQVEGTGKAGVPINARID